MRKKIWKDVDVCAVALVKCTAFFPHNVIVGKISISFDGPSFLMEASTNILKSHHSYRLLEEVLLLTRLKKNRTSSLSLQVSSMGSMNVTGGVDNMEMLDCKSYLLYV